MKRFRFPIAVLGTFDVEAVDMKDARAKANDFVNQDDIDMVFGQMNIDDVQFMPRKGKEVKGNE
jgi:hypothetical protein